MVASGKLPNGVAYVCDQRPNTGKVAMRITFRAGSMHEAPDEAGLTNLTMDACWGGTKTRSRDQIAEEIESRGGSLSSDTDRSRSWFAAQSLARETPAIFAALADVARNPSFPASEIEITRDMALKNLAQQDQKAESIARKGFYEAAFSGQSAAHPPAGSQAQITSYTQQQIRRQHEKLLAHPENIVISFAGDIDPVTAKKLAEQYFGDLKGAAAAPLPATIFKGGDIRSSNKNEQLSLIFGFEAPSATDKQRYAVAMLDELLSGGMSSPLFQEIREKRGLVYSVGSNYVPLDSSGVFFITAGTGKGNASELIPVAFNLLGELATKGFSKAELSRAKERMVRGLKGQLESDETACAHYAKQMLNFGRAVTLEEYDAQLSLVSPEDIQAACASMLRSGKYALGASGPLDGMPSQKEISAIIAEAVKNAPVFTAATVKKTLTPSFARAAKAPEPAAAAPQVTILKNGMAVVTAERPGSLACGAWVGAGADHETPELNGATHMNEHMMFKGTPSYGPGEIDRIVEGELGGDLNAYTDKDKTAYYFYNLLPKDIAKVVDICGEMVFKANLDHAEFDGKVTQNPDGTATKNKGERDVVIEEIKRSSDNINSRIWNLICKAAFPGQPHGRPILGTETTLRAMTVQALAAYRDDYYAPNNVVFSAAGPVRHKDFVALIEQKFGHMKPVSVPPLPQQNVTGGVLYDEVGSAKLCQTIFATKGVADTHPDYLAYEALGAILGGGGSSRLYKALVNRTSLTNGVYAGNYAHRNCGLFVVSLATEAARTKEAVQIIYREILSATRTVTARELDKVKAAMEMEALSDIETNSDACDTIAKEVLGTGRVSSATELSARIQKLTLADIRRVAQQVLAADPVFAGVIPAGTDRSLLPAYAEMLALRDRAIAPKGRGGPQPH